MISFSVLGSGSKGNAVYVESNETALLIDCGFSGKEVGARLHSIGKTLASIEGILVTHEHNDHIAGVGVVARKCKIPVYANEGTLKGGEKKLGKIAQPKIFDTGTSFAIKDITVKPFRISHDTQDPVGYVLEAGDVRLGYCTDTGKATHLMAQRLKGCHGLVLEFNHDLEMLKNGPYPLMVQQRVKSSHGHLSNDDATSFFNDIYHDQLQHVVLAHLSEANNLPQFAISGIESDRTRYQSTNFEIARQDCPTSLITLSF